MTTVKLVAAHMALAAVLAFVTGCGSSAGDASQPAQSSPTAGAGHDGSGFDPCGDIGDQVVRDVGFNPATREPEPTVGDYTDSCQFSSAEMSLIVSTAITSFEDFRDRYVGLRVGLDINNRPAVIVRKPQIDLPCELAMKDGDGIVMLQTTLNVTAKEWGMDRCARIVDIATGIEPLIGSR